MTGKPWDARLAAWLIRPLINTRVHPNVLTTVRLVIGLAGAALFAGGLYFNAAAVFVVVSNFLDHTDGELARVTGKTSRFGHYYDLLSDGIVTVGLFVGLGIGLQPDLGRLALAYGAVAGFAIAVIFQLRHLIESELGKIATRQTMIAGFETEDVLYLIPLVTVYEQESLFLTAAAIGAPIGLAVVTTQYLKAQRGTRGHLE